MGANAMFSPSLGAMPSKAAKFYMDVCCCCYYYCYFYCCCYWLVGWLILFVYGFRYIDLCCYFFHNIFEWYINLFY